MRLPGVVISRSVDPTVVSLSRPFRTGRLSIIDDKRLSSLIDKHPVTIDERVWLRETTVDPTVKLGRRNRSELSYQNSSEDMFFKVGLEVALLSCVIGLTTGFIPTTRKLAAANLLFSDIYDVLFGEKTITHSHMTCQAILQTVADIFIANPNPNYHRSSQNVQRLLRSNIELDVSKLINAYYFYETDVSRKQRKKKLCNSIGVVTKYNAKVDKDELKKAAAHFDSEQFEAAQNRLITFRSCVVTLSTKNNPDYDDAREHAGRLLHTLQDFYSHTNWIENWVDEVGTIRPYSVLGEPNKMIENIADLTNPCSDCPKVGFFSRTFYKVRLNELNIFSFGQIIESTSVYECNNNLDSSLKAQKLLTSGYSNGGKDMDNKVIIKPNGKCSHGGIIDGTSDQPAKGGINKDSVHRELAPHHKYHGTAAAVARRHTHKFLLSIRNDMQNDRLFSEFLGLKVKVTTPTVIDTALKTSDDLAEIQEMISRVSADMQQYIPDMTIQYILVPLNDTGKHAISVELLMQGNLSKGQD